MCSYTLTAIPECRREGVSPGVYTARPVSKLRDSSRKIVDELNEFHYVFLNVSYPGWVNDFERSKDLLNKLEQITEFQLTYQKDEVYLFTKTIN